MAISIQPVPTSFGLEGFGNLSTQERLSQSATQALSSRSSPSAIVTLASDTPAPLVYNAAGLIQTSFQTSTVSGQTPLVQSASQPADITVSDTAVNQAQALLKLTESLLNPSAGFEEVLQLEQSTDGSTTVDVNTIIDTGLNLLQSAALNAATTVAPATTTTPATTATPVPTTTPAIEVTQPTEVTPTITVTPVATVTTVATATAVTEVTTNDVGLLQTLLANAAAQARARDPANATYGAAAVAYYLSVSADNARSSYAKPLNRINQVQQPERVIPLPPMPQRS